jgi:hypothetical protein
VTGPGALLAHYAAMIQAAREGRLTILQEDGTLSDWSRVVVKIGDRLERGELRDRDLARLREVAGEFRRAKEEQGTT